MSSTFLVSFSYASRKKIFNLKKHVAELDHQPLLKNHIQKPHPNKISQRYFSRNYRTPLNVYEVEKNIPKKNSAKVIKSNSDCPTHISGYLQKLLISFLFEPFKIIGYKLLGKEEESCI